MTAECDSNRLAIRPISVGVVVIGRNEGKWLITCLRSAISNFSSASMGNIVYVDSGSTDGSPEQAEQLRVRVIRLSPDQPFTAARGRNEGLAALRSSIDGLTYVQFVDGDSELTPGWIEAACAFMDQRSDVAIVCGRLHERHPERSVYNQLCQIEWDAPSGEISACGGIALVRVEPLVSVGAFRSDLAAGEEPELCIRLRNAGWAIWRIDRDMAVHDANITGFFQWWRRMVRGGTGFAQITLLHRRSPHRLWKRETARAVVWGGLLPLAIAASAMLHPAGLLLGLLYPFQTARIAFRLGFKHAFSWRYGILMTIGKFAEFQGILRFIMHRV